MDILDKRLNDKGKNWRHVLKALKVLDYCLHEGSELVVTWARKNIYIIKTLREFQHIDEDGRDVGQNSKPALRRAETGFANARRSPCLRKRTHIPDSRRRETPQRATGSPKLEIEGHWVGRLQRAST
jgi:hypothetical protein